MVYPTHYASLGCKHADSHKEILTHILSHLHPESHSAVALVSKRFYALITEPHAWRMAFIRYFPGHNVLAASVKKSGDASPTSPRETVRRETRLFTRLTPTASWRSEYLLRTRLLRNVIRGKPSTNSGGIGQAARSASGKRNSAVLTYNSKLAWTITHIHASFTAGKRAPRVVHGAADFCIGTASDPTNGKIDKWGQDDPFAFAQLDDAFPQLQLYGVGDGPAAVPNVMDVSQAYGIVGGEGFPGGRTFFRPINELRGRYLAAQSNGVAEQDLDIPRVPELSEAISCIWVAKSSTVPSMTNSMVGIMTGSTLGIITTYALGHDASGPRYFSGDITARWVLSPGVPIIAIKIDEAYNVKRKAMGRVWAVALNALGEVFYLKNVPTPAKVRPALDGLTRAAWHAGRTAYWELVEPTRRTANVDDLSKNAVRGTYSPRSPANSMMLSREQLVAEAREIEKFLRHKPSHFRKVCQGWDMRRKLEVDFASGDDSGAGEKIFTFSCGFNKEQYASIRRYTRCRDTELFQGHQEPIWQGQQSSSAVPSVARAAAAISNIEISDSESGASLAIADEDWRVAVLRVPGNASTVITATGIDQTTFALVCPFEDPLHATSPELKTRNVYTPTSRQSTGEIPGRRARLLAVGTNNGTVVAWNTRDASTDEIWPIRVIATDSPEVTSIAISALYIIHGGSDGIVQAWDPLASVLEPVRTINSRTSGRVNRHILRNNPALADANFSSVGAIFLDQDPTVLRGVLAFGTFVRFWSYSSTSQTASRKRRTRISDIHGRQGSRRHGAAVTGYIAAEQAELRTEQEHRARERARLKSRFGVGLGDLTDEEALRYAQMISEESFLEDEHRRQSASDNNLGETASSSGTLETVTPEPSLSGQSKSPPTAAGSPSILHDTTDDDEELQIQRAIRLSLLEGVNDAGQSPRDNSPPEFDFQVKFRARKDKGRRSASTSPSVSVARTPQPGGSKSPAGAGLDADLELALRLSLLEDETMQNTGGFPGVQDDEEFPGLESRGKGKGRAR
jgi:hypothetical protein